MTKNEFLSSLGTRIQALPKEEFDRTIAYYEEIIEDRVEEGMTEEEAVASMESLDTIVHRIMTETPLKTFVKGKVESKKKMETWQIVLLAVTSPIWIPLVIAFLSTMFGLFMGAIGCVIGLFAATFGLLIGGLVAVVGSIFVFISQGAINGLFTLGIGFGCLGVGILLFSGCMALAKGVIYLIKKFVLWIKRCLSR